MRTSPTNVAVLSALATLFVTVAAPTTLPAQTQSKDQQKCVNTMNKDGAKVAAT